MTKGEIELVKGARYRITRPGAKMLGTKPWRGGLAPGCSAQEGCTITMEPGDEIEYLGMLYSGGSDGVSTHQFRHLGTHPDAPYVKDFRPKHPGAECIFDTRPDPAFLERVM